MGIDTSAKTDSERSDSSDHLRSRENVPRCKMISCEGDDRDHDHCQEFERIDRLHVVQGDEDGEEWYEEERHQEGRGSAYQGMY